MDSGTSGVYGLFYGKYAYSRFILRTFFQAGRRSQNQKPVS